MKRESLYISLAFFIGICYRLLIGLQGIDTIDMGFCMTFYQNIFSHPDSMTFYFCYYLTGFFGGLWHSLMGSFGLLGFRFLETITMSVAVLLVFLSFLPWLKSVSYAVGAILVSYLFPSFVLTFHYDTLSYLFMAASLYAAMRWLRADALPWLGLAGAFIGICFFARIVNGSLAALILLPFIAGWLKSTKQAIVNSVVYVGGLLSGILLVVLLLLATNQWTFFGAAITEAFSTFSGHETSHTSGNLFGVYLKSYVNIGLQMLVMAAIAFLYRFSNRLQRTLRFGCRIFLPLGILVLVATSQPYLSAIAAGTLLVLATWRKLDRARTLLMVYAAACAYLFPFGSDIGIPGIFHWCAGLLIIPAASCCQLMVHAWQRQMVLAVCLSASACMLYKMLSSVNGEEAPRYELMVPALQGSLNTFTTAEKARRYQNEVTRIRQYAGDTNFLLIANQASELYYATGMIPFTGNTQMDAFKNKSLLERLNQQQAFHRQLPMVVFLKHDHDTPDMPEYRETLTPWMEQHHYRKTYDDDDIIIFQIPMTTL